jgi:serine/threonine protein kinase
MPSKIDQYTCIKTLGSGISAKVKLATDPQGQYVALKVFNKSNPQNTVQAMKTLQDEVNAYMTLKH